MLTIVEQGEYFHSTEDPDFWGPSFWLILHNGAASYPEEAPPMWRRRMRGFIEGIPYMVTCYKCRQHAIAYIDAHSHDLDLITSGRRHLFKFFVDFHNAVNARLGKPVVSLEEAVKLYSSACRVRKVIVGKK